MPTASNITATLYVAAAQKTAILILTAVKIWNPNKDQTVTLRIPAKFKYLVHISEPWILQSRNSQSHC